MYCPKCHTPPKSGDKFCQVCGTKLLEEPSYTPSVSTKKKSPITIILLSVAIVVFAGFTTFAVINLSNSQSIETSSNTSSTSTSAVSGVVSSNVISSSSRSSSSSSRSSSSSSRASSSSSHRYEVVVDKIGWQTAKTKAEQKGGHLVTINSQEEFDKIKNLLSSYNDVRNVWVGACVPESYSTVEDIKNYWKSSNAKWITGETFSFTKWRSGEPSGGDDRTGVLERYLQIFSPKIDNYEWSFNDAGDDLSSYVDGILAYIVEYE